MMHDNDNHFTSLLDFMVVNIMTSIREHKIDLFIISQVSIPMHSALNYVSIFKINLFIFFKIFQCN